MALSDEEYQRMKRDEEDARKKLKKEDDDLHKEFMQRREDEMFQEGKIRLEIASKVAANLAANPALDAEAVADRAFQVAAAMIEKMKKELESLHR